MTARKHFVVWSGIAALLVAAYFAYDWRFWVRHFQSPPDERIIYDFDWYTPKVRIGEGAGRDIPVVSDAAHTIDPAALAHVVDYARDLDSYAFIVARNGTIEAEYYKEGFGPDSLFDSQSMHKGLLSLAFGLAVDRGAIPDLDAPAATYLPEWQNDGRAKITIRQLLANTSGLAEPEFAERPWSGAYRLFIADDPDGTALSVPLERSPGETFRFNHVNAQVLHAVLTRATKQSYPDLLKSYLWPQVGNGAAQVRLDVPGGQTRAVCCFQTTARSWLRIAQLILDHGRAGDTQVISERWVTEMTAPGAVNPKFGFNLYLGQPEPRRAGSAGGRVQPTRASEPFAAADVRYFEGRGGQRTMWIPSQNLAIIRIGKINFAWDDAKVINPLIAALKN
ncbi:MAG: serine hydrolase [Rhodospirillaceae bacterium]|nr:serine hydrolase [Rhodospirillaceae bacterium]